MDRLKAIDTFVKIARSRSLSEAARSLEISRGLASVHLKQLEDHLGVRLINRTTRQLSLTEAGQDYFEFCNKMLESFEEKDAELTRSQASPRGHLKVLASAAYAEYVLAPIVAKFCSVHPEVQVSLLASGYSSPSGLVEFGYDLAITMHPVEELSMVTARLGQVRWRPYAAPSYLKERGTPTTPQQLENHNCLHHRSISPDSMWRFYAPDGPVEVKVKGPLITNNVMILRQFVVAGMGIGLLPSYCIVPCNGRAELIEVLPDYATVSRDVYIVYSSTKYLPKKVRVFLDFLKSGLREQTRSDRDSRAKPAR